MSGSRKKKLKKEFIEAVGKPPNKAQMRKLKKMYVERGLYRVVSARYSAR